ncbi:ATP-binding protein [Streptomyces sp. NPDC055134]
MTSAAGQAEKRGPRLRRDGDGVLGRGFLLRLLSYEDEVRVEVHDSGDGTPQEADVQGESGRGLFLVEALADKWGVERRDPGKTVWCTFSLRGA